MRKLTFCNADVTTELAWPELVGEITLESSALEVFTDFSKTKPLVIDAETNAVEAERLMQNAHVRLKVVVDKGKHFLGIVSLQDLNGQDMMIKISEGVKREELSVSDFTQPRNRLKGLRYVELSKASIRNVINTLKNNDQQHCVVIDDDQRRLRGIMSASDMARKLRLPLDILNDSSFSAISRAIQH